MAAGSAIPGFRVVLATALAVMLLVLLAWMGIAQSRVGESRAATKISNPSLPPLRLGIVPERDILQQRRRFQALTEYMSAKLGRPIELATAAAYQDVLDDFANKSLDGAFLGSFMTVLAADRVQARPLVRPVMEGEEPTYQGVLIVRQDSPISRFDDLRGRNVAGVRTTMAGHLFPFAELKKRDMLGEQSVGRMVWVGTHDDVIQAVVDGKADAGAVKSPRLEAYESAHPEVKFHRLLTSDAVPENALVIRQDVDEQLSAKLGDLLLQMVQDEQGRKALKAFGAVRFDPCRIDEYEAVFKMVDQLGSSWPALGLMGPAPRRKHGGKG